MIKISGYALALLLACATAASEQVTYTNAELTAMSDASVIADKTRTRSVIDWWGTKSECQKYGGVAGDRFMTGSYILKVVEDTDARWKLVGYDNGVFKTTNCTPVTAWDGKVLQTQETDLQVGVAEVVCRGRGRYIRRRCRSRITTAVTSPKCAATGRAAGPWLPALTSASPCQP